MRYIVIHIPTGKFLSYKGTKKNGDFFCGFDSGIVKKLKPGTIEGFRKRCLSFCQEGDLRYRKYLNKTDAELELLFIKTPLKFKSVAEAESALLSAPSIPTIGKFRSKVTEEELVLFDIIETPDD